MDHQGWTPAPTLYVVEKFFLQKYWKCKLAYTNPTPPLQNLDHSPQNVLNAKHGRD